MRFFAAHATKDEEQMRYATLSGPGMARHLPVDDEVEEEDKYSDEGEPVPTEVAYRQYSAPNPRKKARCASEDEESAILRAKLAAYQRVEAQNLPASGKKKSKKTSEATELEVLIKNTLREKCWRSIKFVTSAAQLEAATARVLDALGLPELDKDNPDHADARKLWIDRHTEVVCKALNDVRSYVQTRMRDVANEYMAGHGGKLPKKSILEKFTRHREANVEDEDEMEVLVWWVDKMLPRATANTYHFGPNKRYYQCLARVVTDGQLDMPAGTEAFAFLMHENCYLRWQYMYQLKQKCPGKRIVVCKNRDSAKTTSNPQNHVVYTAEVHQLKVPWTLPDIGQAKCGGWKPEGIKHWVKIKKENTSSRITGGSANLELRILELMRQANGVSQSSPEEQKRANGGLLGVSTQEFPEIEDVFDD